MSSKPSKLKEKSFNREQILELLSSSSEADDELSGSDLEAATQSEGELRRQAEKEDSVSCISDTDDEGIIQRIRHAMPSLEIYRQRRDRPVRAAEIPANTGMYYVIHFFSLLYINSYNDKPKLIYYI